MCRFLPAVAAVAAVAVFAVPSTAYALRIAFAPPAQRAINSDVVVVGKVASIGKDDVEATSPYRGAKDKIKYKVATIKIESGLAGADKMTEVKVGFIPPPKPGAGGPGRPPIRPGGFGAPELKEGQQWLLFLTRHPTADFYVIPPMNLPIDPSNEQGKKDVEAVKKVIAALADPMKGLKSDKADVRAETAVAVLMKYRTFPGSGGPTEEVPITADESKLILKGLTEADWGNNFRGGAGAGLSAMQAFGMLNLTPKDGWVQPAIVNVPGAPPIDYAAVNKDAFTKWLEGAGKNYVVKKVVAKK